MSDFKKYAKLSLSGDITVWCEKCSNDSTRHFEEGSVWEKRDYNNPRIDAEPKGSQYYGSTFVGECEHCDTEYRFDLYIRLDNHSKEIPNYFIMNESAKCHLDFDTNGGALVDPENNGIQINGFAGTTDSKKVAMDYHRGKALM